jgi:hypothetical protein
VVSVFATGPIGRGFESGKGDEFLKTIKIRNKTYFGWEVKPELPCRKILRHVKISRHVESPTGTDRLSLISFAHSPTLSRAVSADMTARQYWWLPERSGRRIRS